MYMHFKGKKKILVLNMLNKNKNNRLNTPAI